LALAHRPDLTARNTPLRPAALAALLLLAVLAACAPRPPAGPPVIPPKPPAFALKAAAFSDLPGWQEDDLAAALPAFRLSCPRLTASSSAAGLEGFAAFGRAADWQAFCGGLAAIPPGDTGGFRRLIEAELQPVQVLGEGGADGLFTGYYEPSLRGSRRRQPGFEVPILGLPDDLVQVDLGQFRPDWRGQRIAGRVQAGQLRPYDDRAAIEAGALGQRARPLVWVNDPVAAFFLHIQGSGRVELQEGGLLRLGFAGQNGHPYTAIGRVLIDRGALTREEVSMPRLKQWLQANPAEAPALLRENRSYVFFRELPPPAGASEVFRVDGPLGAQGLPLLAGRSLAVDRSHFAMGLPVWLDASRPRADGAGDLPLRRLMVAQDTGGAIRGAVRGDVFWGHGPEAEAVAGLMKQPGRFWLLLPRSVMRTGG